MDARQHYPSDLADREWSQIERFIPAPKSGGRPAKYERREIVNALLYIDRTGCQWRALPHDFPPWEAVYWYFRSWKKDGTLDRLHDELRGDLRVAVGRQRQPSAAILDSQSVRTTEKGGPKAMTAVRGSPAASGISSSTPWDSSLPSWSTPPASKITTA